MKKPRKKQTKKQVLAEIFNVPNLEVIRPHVLEKLQDGIICNLDIQFWRARTKLQLSDIGIPDAHGEDFSELFSLGKKYLLPANIIASMEALESRARKWLKAKAWDTFWGCFVHYSQWTEFRDGIEKIQKDFNQLGDEIYERFDEIVALHTEAYAAEIEEAWRRLKKLERKVPPKDEFSQALLTPFKEAIISAEEFKDRFQFQIRYSQIPLPSKFVQDELRIERMTARRDAQREKEELTRRVVEEKQLAKLRAAQLERNITDEALRVREQMLEEMNHAVVESARQQKEEQIEKFIRDFAIQIRGTIYECCLDLLTAIKTNNRLPPRSLTQIKNLAKNIENMNEFMRDADAEQMINALRQKVSKLRKVETGLARPIDEVQDLLQDIACVSRASLIALDANPRSVPDLGIVLSPSPEMSRIAMKRIVESATDTPIIMKSSPKRRGIRTL